MIKTFYKKNPPIKLFFSSDMQYRSVAYGQEIFAKYLSWLNMYNEYRCSDQKSFWVNSQGDIGNNLLKGPYEKSYRNVFNYREQKSRSLLCPLMFGERLFEIDEQGHLFINGKENVFLINDPKAWALMVVSERDAITLKLVVLGGVSNVETEVAFFDVDDNSVVKSQIKPIELTASADAESYLLCLERHLFTVHNGVLRYYYINTEKNEAEEVAIGSDCVGEENELCRDILRCMVADQSGKVYWCTEKTIYAMRIGAPKDVIVVDTLKERDIVKLQTYKNYLFVYSKNSSGRAYAVHFYIITPDGVRKNELGYGIYQVIIADVTPTGFRYIQTGPAETEFVNEFGGRRVERELIDKSTINEKTFYLNGNIISGARAIGCDKERNYIIIK